MPNGSQAVLEKIKMREMDIEIMQKLLKLKLTSERVKFRVLISYYKIYNALLKVVIKIER